jgi:hypothetical protein
MRAWSRLLTLCTTGAIVFAVAPTVANAGGYPFNCPKQTVLVVEHDAPNSDPTEFTGPTAIQDAVVLANGLPGADTDPENPEASANGGDTVIVCNGTYSENISVPLADAGGDNSNITIRSFDDASNPTIIGAAGAPVISIEAPGVLLGGTHLGFEITGASNIGIQVGVPAPINFDEDDDQEITECGMDGQGPTECPDVELAPFATSNVAIVGNEIRNLTTGIDGIVTGISVNNTNNTLIFRNKVDRLTAGADEMAYGIRYSDTNYNNEVLSNEVTHLTQTGGACTGSSLETPLAGAVGVAIQDEALDALVHMTAVDEVKATCTAVGVYSNAWGGLENTRNGQQVPIVTDVLDNRIKKVDSTSADQTAGVALAPLTPANNDDQNDDDNAPSSFRVLANDIDDTEVSVAVLTGLAPNSWIRENDLDHDQIGVLNNSALNVDATNNWWGCQEGPLSGKKECSTVAGPGTVSVNPWLKSHAAHAGAHAGEYAGH